MKIPVTLQGIKIPGLTELPVTTIEDTMTLLGKKNFISTERIFWICFDEKVDNMKTKEGIGSSNFDSF